MGLASFLGYILTIQKGYKRIYFVAKVHNGIVTFIKIVLGDYNFSFESDEFSTYALFYEDVKDSTSNSIVSSTIPKTSDNIILYITLLGLSSFILNKKNKLLNN